MSAPTITIIGDPTEAFRALGLIPAHATPAGWDLARGSTPEARTTSLQAVAVAAAPSSPAPSPSPPPAVAAAPAPVQRQATAPSTRAADETDETPQKGAKRNEASIAALTEQLCRQIGSLPGQRIEQLAKTLGVPTKHLLLPIKKLLGIKRIRKTGQRRGTVYYAALALAGPPSAHTEPEPIDDADDASDDEAEGATA